jgi:hypothetical protein
MDQSPCSPHAPRDRSGPKDQLLGAHEKRRILALQRCPRVFIRVDRERRTISAIGSPRSTTLFAALVLSLCPAGWPSLIQRDKYLSKLIPWKRLLPTTKYPAAYMTCFHPTSWAAGYSISSLETRVANPCYFHVKARWWTLTSEGLYRQHHKWLECHLSNVRHTRAFYSLSPIASTIGPRAPN